MINCIMLNTLLQAVYGCIDDKLNRNSFKLVVLMLLVVWEQIPKCHQIESANWLKRIIVTSEFWQENKCKAGQIDYRGQIR